MLQTGATFVWCSLAALAGAPSADAAARALATTAAYAGPVRHLADFAAEDGEAPMTFRFGRSPATSVAVPLALGAAASNSWVAVAEGLRSGRQLADALAAVEGKYDLDGWRDLIRPLDAEDIPPELLDSLVDCSDPRLGVALLAPVYQPISTPWLPLPPVQGQAPPGAPACIDSAMDMLLERCLSDVGQWLDDTLSDLTHIRDELRNGAEPASIERRRPRALAIGQGCLHDWARGVVWDCTSRQASSVFATLAELPIDGLVRPPSISMSHPSARGPSRPAGSLPPSPGPPGLAPQPLIDQRAAP